MSFPPNLDIRAWFGTLLMQNPGQESLVWVAYRQYWQRQIADPNHPYHWITKLPEPDFDYESWFGDLQ